MRREIDVDADATAYGNRTANFSVAAFGMSRERMNALWGEISVHFTGFILAADDAPSIELFAAEVAPATRELVAAEHARR